MKNYHATVHDEETNEIIFGAQVYAETSGEAHNKVAKHLTENGKSDVAKIGAVLMEIGHRQDPALLLIE